MKLLLMHPCALTISAAGGVPVTERERINLSLTEDGLKLLDRERKKLGLVRSAFVELMLRWWTGQIPPQSPPKPPESDA